MTSPRLSGLFYDVTNKFIRRAELIRSHRFHLQRMSDIESSSSSYFGSEDPQWLFLVTLFMASVVTVILYFVQYFQQGAVVFKPRAEDDVANKEAASLLGWALSLESWKSKWREAWCRALSDESRKLGVSSITTELPLQTGELIKNS